jgi:ferredoxin
MKLNEFESEDRMSRREFLRIPRPKNTVALILDKEKCTGCSLCTIDCPTKALTLSQDGGPDTYQILFRQEICNGCGVCEKSCPERCLRMTDQEPEENQIGKDAKILFDDQISRCVECGIPLFPRAMMKKLESKVFTVKGDAWPLHLCPSCRVKAQFAPSPSPSPSRREVGTTRNRGEGGGGRMRPK